MSDMHGVSSLRKRNMSVLSVVSFIYCAVAAGAFGIEEMIPACGPGMTIVILIGLALLWALPICFVYAELASVLPGEGGFYYWAKNMFGEFWGFQVGWWNAVDFYVCGGSLVVLAVNYLSTLTGMDPLAATCVKVGIVVVVALVNLAGIKEAGWLSTAFSLVILVGFAALTIVGFANFTIDPLDPLVPEGQGILEGLSNGLGYGIWMYAGWEVIVCVAGEIRNTSVLPRALIIAVPLVALSYLLPTIAALGSVGQWESWTTLDTAGGVGFQTVFSQFVGPWAGTAFLVVAIIGQLAIYNTNVAGGSRAFFVLSDDNLFPKVLGEVSKRRGVPDIGILTISLVTIVLVQFPFTTLVLIQVVCALASALVTCLCLLRARKVIPLEQRKGGVIIPGGRIGLRICTALPIAIALIALYFNGLDYFVVGLAFFSVTGPVLYVLNKRCYGGLSHVDNDKYPLNPRTKLTCGDLSKLAAFFTITGIMSVAASFLIRLIEGEWGPEYYAELYADAGALSWLADFDFALLVALILGIVLLAVSAVLRLATRKVDNPQHQTTHS